MDKQKPQRVVCAAIRLMSGVTIVGARHMDKWMYGIIEALKLEPHDTHGMEQGFIDNRGNFLTRQEALGLAKVRGQVYEDRVGAILYSEDLY